MKLRFLLAGAPLILASVRQRCVSLSTAQSEVIALSQGVKHALALGNFLSEIGEEAPRPLRLMVDNRAVITLANTSIFAKGLRHVDLSYHHINDEVKKGRVAVEFVGSKDQLADMLTKPLERMELQRMVNRLLSDIPARDMA